ncbi:uncharacterized protein LOC130718639 [Lotus japonicus]|uniref:uncharacterized protein LOC130718639 n=1 Tax=Lotus japonicus TaxID=34305 RepID=UPI0025911B57|nr:uncharacterized protein LOC130718639 [Lotus japonicus]
MMCSSSESLFSPSSPLSNVEQFLLSVTPHVPSSSLFPKSCVKELNIQWLPFGKDKIDYFTLKDLWECYEEWSAWGVGTPVMLEDGDTLIQYYVPYLSAIEIYTTKSVVASRNRREDGDSVELGSDSSLSDDDISRSLSNNSSKAWDVSSFNSRSHQEGSWPTRDMLGYLYLQYNEKSSPRTRVPFLHKISELAQSYPALMTLKSVDISPASWMAVAWYPIYTIPNQASEKDTTTCFLTYHTLSSSFQDCADNGIGKNICSCNCWGSDEGDQCKEQDHSFISLTPFGLASYKLQRNIWLSSSFNGQRMYDLYSAADSWLKQLNAHHDDFNFFRLRSD